MSDIVESLRALSEEYRDHDPDVVAFSAEAAAEITRLRAELAKAKRERDAWEKEAIESRDWAEAAERDREAAKAEAERLRGALEPRLANLEALLEDHGYAAQGALRSTVAECRAALQEKAYGKT